MIEEERQDEDTVSVNIDQTGLSPTTKRRTPNAAPKNVAEKDNLFDEEIGIFGKPNSNTVEHKAPQHMYDRDRRYSCDGTKSKDNKEN